MSIGQTLFQTLFQLAFGKVLLRFIAYAQDGQVQRFRSFGIQPILICTDKLMENMLFQRFKNTAAVRCHSGNFSAAAFQYRHHGIFGILKNQRTFFAGYFGYVITIVQFV